MVDEMQRLTVGECVSCMEGHAVDQQGGKREHNPLPRSRGCDGGCVDIGWVGVGG